MRIAETHRNECTTRKPRNEQLANLDINYSSDTQSIWKNSIQQVNSSLISKIGLCSTLIKGAIAVYGAPFYNHTYTLQSTWKMCTLRQRCWLGDSDRSCKQNPMTVSTFSTFFPRPLEDHVSTSSFHTGPKLEYRPRTKITCANMNFLAIHRPDNEDVFLSVVLWSFKQNY